MPNLPSWVSKFADLPFEERGRTIKGADCWGLVCLISKEIFGIKLPSYDGRYRSTADIDETAALFTHGLPEWREVIPKPGAIILFRIHGMPAHVGMVITAPDERQFDPGYFIHCEHGLNSCVEQYNHARWVKRRIGFFEYVGSR